MDPVEPAITEHGNHIVGQQLRNDTIHDGVGIFFVERRAA